MCEQSTGRSNAARMTRNHLEADCLANCLNRYRFTSDQRRRRCRRRRRQTRTRTKHVNGGIIVIGAQLFSRTFGLRSAAAALCAPNVRVSVYCHDKRVCAVFLCTAVPINEVVDYDAPFRRLDDDDRTSCDDCTTSSRPEAPHIRCRDGRFVRDPNNVVLIGSGRLWRCVVVRCARMTRQKTNGSFNAKVTSWLIEILLFNAMRPCCETHAHTSKRNTHCRASSAEYAHTFQSGIDLLIDAFCIHHQHISSGCCNVGAKFNFG